MGLGKERYGHVLPGTRTTVSPQQPYGLSPVLIFLNFLTAPKLQLLAKIEGSRLKTAWWRGKLGLELGREKSTEVPYVYVSVYIYSLPCLFKLDNRNVMARPGI